MHFQIADVMLRGLGSARKLFNNFNQFISILMA